MKINTPIRIAIFLSVVIFAFAIIIFYLIDDRLNVFYGLILFFLFVISLIYYVVKKFFHENSDLKENSNRHLPPSFNSSPKLKIISKKPILPNETEFNHNIRSRSAKLRVAEKLQQKDKNISEAA